MLQVGRGAYHDELNRPQSDARTMPASMAQLRIKVRISGTKYADAASCLVVAVSGNDVQWPKCSLRATQIMPTSEKFEPEVFLGTIHGVSSSRHARYWQVIYISERAMMSVPDVSCVSGNHAERAAQRQA